VLFLTQIGSGKACLRGRTPHTECEGYFGLPRGIYRGHSTIPPTLVPQRLKVYLAAIPGVLQRIATQLLAELRAGDILVADSYYCRYWLLAECRRRGVQVVMRNGSLGMDILRGQDARDGADGVVVLLVGLQLDPRVHAASRLAQRPCLPQPEPHGDAATVRQPVAVERIRQVDAFGRELFLGHQFTIQVEHCPGRNDPQASMRRPKILRLLAHLNRA
jgi:hypothetical protein